MNISGFDAGETTPIYSHPKPVDRSLLQNQWLDLLLIRKLHRRQADRLFKITALLRIWHRFCIFYISGYAFTFAPVLVLVPLPLLLAIEQDMELIRVLLVLRLDWKEELVLGQVHPPTLLFWSFMLLGLETACRVHQKMHISGLG